MSQTHLIREHRGSLDDSMQTVQPVRDRAHLVELIHESLVAFVGAKAGTCDVTPEKISLKPYVFDKRIGWDTYLIVIEGYGVWGMANGPIP